ncbi:hypothetical protein [Paraburkholderia sediminicola]|uniref:hypothetical protein n=1 Tax=Paraburkholderia sediminicola TaxID=458836 RepID=UPI0038B897AC
MGTGTAANTHLMYDTNAHEHLDGVIQWATKKGYPYSSLNLVGCRDGRWFVEVDFGSDFNAIEGISRPNIAPYVEPRFFGDDDAAREFAFAAVRQVHPELADVDLDAYYDDEK